MTTVTVRFVPCERSQRDLQVSLDRALTAVTRNANVEPVFPGETNPRWKGNFVVRFSGPDREILAAIRAVPGVEEAFRAPSRQAL